MAYDLGPKIGIDGEAEFRKQIQNVAQQIKTLGSEMGAVTAQFAKNASSQEAAAAKADVLTRQISAQKEKLELQTQALAEATVKYGALDSRTLKWQQTVNESTKHLANLENSLDDVDNSLDDVGNGFDKAGAGALSFGEVLKANVIGDAIINGVKALAGAVKDMAGGFIESAAEVKAQNAQFEQTFAGVGEQAEAAIDRVADAAGILDTRLKETGTQIYAFAKSAGGDTEQSLDIMERALTVAADSAAYYDRSLEDTAETLQSFLKGNFANDAALGLSVTETTRNAAAMELFGEKYKDLTEIQKQETLLKMVEDSMALSGAMGQAARESDGWENVMGNLNETWRQFRSEAGDPFLENLIPIIQEVTSALQGLTTNADWEEFSSKVTWVFQFLIEHDTEILSLVTGIGAGFVTWNVASTIQGVVQAIKAFKAANEGASAAQIILNTAMKANPFVLVATLIAGVVTALVTLYTTNEDFRKKVNNAWDSVRTKVLNFARAFETTIDDFFDNVVAVGEEIEDFFRNFPDEMREIGANLLEGLWNGISNKVTWLKNKVSGVVDTIKGWFTGSDGFDTHSPSKWSKRVFGYVMEGGAEGLEDGLPALMREVSGVIGQVQGGLTPASLNMSYADVAGTMRSGSGVSAATVYNAAAGMVNGLNTGTQNTSYTFNLIWPDGTRIASYLFDPMADYADANGTPILNPT